MKSAEEFIKQYESALATQDWENVSPLIHNDCVAVFSEGTYVGKAQVEKAFKKTFELIKEEKYRLSDVYWVTKTENFAVFICNFHWSGIIHGQQASGYGRGTSTIINNHGCWQLIAEHLGPNSQ